MVHFVRPLLPLFRKSENFWVSQRGPRSPAFFRAKISLSYLKAVQVNKIFFNTEYYMINWTPLKLFAGHVHVRTVHTICLNDKQLFESSRSKFTIETKYE